MVLVTALPVTEEEARGHRAALSSRVVAAVGPLRPVARCSLAPRLPAPPVAGLACDPGAAVSCPAMWTPRRHVRPELAWDSPEAALQRTLVRAELRAWSMPAQATRLPTPGRALLEEPRLHQVGVDGDLAAALGELPRRGMIGGWRKASGGTR